MKAAAYIKQALVTAFLAETICVSYILKFPAWIPAASVIYFITGIAIAVLFVCLPQAKLRLPVFAEVARTAGWYKLLVLVCMAIIMHHFTRAWIINTPLSINDADMLPIMKVMSQLSHLKALCLPLLFYKALTRERVGNCKYVSTQLCSGLFELRGILYP